MRQWGLVKLSFKKTNLRRLSTSTKVKLEDEGSWSYSPEWWGPSSVDSSHSSSIFRATSFHGNGVVSVLSYPSSIPTANCWWKTEDWLRKRYGEVCLDDKHEQHFRVLGYQWRVLRFNDVTRQSAVKVMATTKASDSCSVYYMQQPHVLAVPYTKSMVSVGFTALSSTNYDVINAVTGKKTLRVLCIGHGGGSLPLFIASKIQGAYHKVLIGDESAIASFVEFHGAVVEIVEIDPLVISASIKAMGFPSFSVAASPLRHAMSRPNTMDEVLWKGIHERLFLYELDAEKFILNTENVYDIIFIDAYDGDDIFPCKLWDPESPFLQALSRKLHPSHGTVVVNLHSDDDVLSGDASVASFGKYVSGICRAYRDALISKESSSCGKTLPGVGFTVSVPWVCNTTLVLCRGFSVGNGRLDRDSIMNVLVANSLEVDRDLNMPFSCLQYLNRGFVRFG